jgi:hypothetical protein
MRGFFPALAVAMLCLNPLPARAQATDPFIGEIEAFGFNAHAGGRRSMASWCQ